MRATIVRIATSLGNVATAIVAGSATVKLG